MCLPRLISSLMMLRQSTFLLLAMHGRTILCLARGGKQIAEVRRAGAAAQETYTRSTEAKDRVCSDCAQSTHASDLPFLRLVACHDVQCLRSLY